MKNKDKILILVTNHDRFYFILTYFLPFLKRQGYVNLEKKHQKNIDFDFKHKSWMEEKSLINKEFYTRTYVSEYKNKEIIIKFLDVNELDLTRDNVKSFIKNFLPDKTMVVVPYLAKIRDEILNDVQQINIIFEEMIYGDYSIYDELNKNLERGHKILTCEFPMIKFKPKFGCFENVLHSNLINLIYFYYGYGFNFINVNPLIVEKQHLLGMYLKKKYKPSRERFIQSINNRFNHIKIKNFSKKDEDYDEVEKLEMGYNEGWTNNLMAGYSDYVRSVCNIVFENNEFFEINEDKLQVTEKTLKTILFSNLNILFILICHPITFIQLKELGFWFYNTEFFDFNEYEKSVESNNDESFNSLMLNSVLKTVEHLNNLHIKNEYNINNTHKELVNLYGDKMKNNYTLFKKYLNKPHDCEKVLDFILK